MWRVEFTPKADKQFSKLDKQAQKSIISYMERVVENGDPRLFGKALVGNFSGLWRYRFGKYRLICDITEERLVIEIISIGKRDRIYE